MAEKILLENLELRDFTQHETGFYLRSLYNGFSLTPGDEYKVVWDGEPYICKAYENEKFLGKYAVFIGNEKAVTTGNMQIVEPFLIYYMPDNLYNIFFAMTPDVHYVSIFQNVSDEEEDGDKSDPNDVQIMNYVQDKITYENVPKVWLSHPDSTEETPKLVPFTYGEAVSKSVEPDFSSGDMQVPIQPGELVTELTVVQPPDLTPDKIAAGEYIAGVGPGTHEGENVTEEVVTELSMSIGDQVIEPTDGKSFSKVTVLKPDTLKPQNIVEGVNIGGIIGTAAAAKDGAALIYSKVKTFNVIPSSSTVGATVQIASASELAACGIDLTQYTSWYKSGQAYIPLIMITSLVDTDTIQTSTYRKIANGWISNVAHKPSSGSQWYNGNWTWWNTTGYYGGTVTLNVPNTASNPLAQPFSYATANKLLYVTNGNVYATVYYSSSVRYTLVGKYLVTVSLIPAS